MEKYLRLPNEKVECVYSTDTVVVKWPAFCRVPLRHFIDLYRENRAMYRNCCRAMVSFSNDKKR